MYRSYPPKIKLRRVSTEQGSGVRGPGAARGFKVFGLWFWEAKSNWWRFPFASCNPFEAFWVQYRYYLIKDLITYYLYY